MLDATPKGQLTSTIALESYRDATACLIRSSSDGEFPVKKAENRQLNCNGGVAGDLVTLHFNQTFGNKNRMGCRFVEKVALRPKTVQLSSSLAGPRRAASAKGEEHCTHAVDAIAAVSAHKISPARAVVTKTPLACAHGQRRDGHDGDAGIGAILSVEKKLTQNYTASPRVQQHFFSRAQVDSPDPTEQPQQEVDSDVEWKRWRLQQYQIWENILPQLDDAQTQNKVAERPHSTPNPLKLTSGRNEFAFPPRDVGSVVFSPGTPLSSLSSTRPHTAGVSIMRATIFVPSPMPPSTSLDNSATADEENIAEFPETTEEAILSADAAALRENLGSFFGSTESRDVTATPVALQIHSDEHGNVVGGGKFRGVKSGKRRSSPSRRRKTHGKPRQKAQTSQLLSNSLGERPPVRFVVKNSFGEQKEKKRKVKPVAPKTRVATIGNEQSIVIPIVGDEFWGQGNCVLDVESPVPFEYDSASSQEVEFSNEIISNFVKLRDDEKINVTDIEKADSAPVSVPHTPPPVQPPPSSQRRSMRTPLSARRLVLAADQQVAVPVVNLQL